MSILFMTQDNFVIMDDNMRKRLLQCNDHMNLMVASITHIITFTTSDPPWLEVVLGESKALSSLWLQFKMSKAWYYMPLGWNEWSVARCVSLPIDHTHRKLHIFNHQMTWKIEDHWPMDPWSGVKEDYESSSSDDKQGSSDNNNNDDDGDNDGNGDGGYMAESRTSPVSASS